MMTSENFQLTHETILFLREYYNVYRYSSRTNHNHFDEIMTQVNPSVIDMAEPLMVMKLQDEYKDNLSKNNDIYVSAVKDVEASFSNQLASADKKKLALSIIKKVISYDDEHEDTIGSIIDLIVSVAKNKELVDAFKKHTFCLKCFYCCGSKKDKK